MSITSAIKSTINKLRRDKSKELGSPLLTPSERLKQTGGTISTSDPSITREKEVESRE